MYDKSVFVTNLILSLIIVYWFFKKWNEKNFKAEKTIV